MIVFGHLFKSLASLLHMLIQIYIFVILIRAVISWIGDIPPNTFVLVLRRLTDPVFRRMHRWFPFLVVGGFDISPIILLLALYFTDSFLVGLLSDAAARILGGTL